MCCLNKFTLQKNKVTQMALQWLLDFISNLIFVSQCEVAEAACNNEGAPAPQMQDLLPLNPNVL
jgi:hypothetical protein